MSKGGIGSRSFADAISNFSKRETKLKFRYGQIENSEAAKVANVIRRPLPNANWNVFRKNATKLWSIRKLLVELSFRKTIYVVGHKYRLPASSQFTEKLLDSVNKATAHHL